jgi:hypothetical protein
MSLLRTYDDTGSIFGSKASQRIKILVIKITNDVKSNE